MSGIGKALVRRRSFLQALAGSALYRGFQPLMRSESAVKITGIETVVLEDPGKYSFTVVRVRTSTGIDGIGQAESPSLVIDAAIRTHGELEDFVRS
jgi:hypothetical protein